MNAIAWGAPDLYELPDGRRCERVFVSALKGQGLDVLREVLAEAATGQLSADSGAQRVPAPRFDMHNALDEVPPQGDEPPSSQSVRT